MMFQGKIDRAMDYLKSKNKREEDKPEYMDDIPFHKLDILAIIISGIIVMAPVFIVLIGILYLFLK